MNQFLEKPCPARWRAKAEVARVRRVEEDDRLGGDAAVLGAAEGEHVDAGPPGHVGRRHAEAGDRAGEARAVHVDAQRRGFGDLRERRDLRRGVGRAELGDLGEADRDRLAVMDDAFREPRHRRRERLRRELAARPVEADDLDAAAEEFRRAGFVDEDVRLAVAEDDAARPGIGRQAKRVRRRAGRHEEDRHLALEELAEAPLDRLGEVVAAVGRPAAAAPPRRARRSPAREAPAQLSLAKFIGAVVERGGGERKRRGSMRAATAALH